MTEKTKKKLFGTTLGAICGAFIGLPFGLMMAERFGRNSMLIVNIASFSVPVIFSLFTGLIGAFIGFCCVLYLQSKNKP
jgi:gas vesicle protein